MSHPRKAGLGLCVGLGLTAGVALLALTTEASAHPRADSTNRAVSARDELHDPWDEEDTNDDTDEGARDTDDQTLDLTPEQRELEEGAAQVPWQREPDLSPEQPQREQPQQGQEQLPEQWQSPRQWQSTQQQPSQQPWQMMSPPPSAREPQPQGGTNAPYSLGPLTGQPGPVWSPYITEAVIMGGWGAHLLRGSGAGIHPRFPQGTSGPAHPHHHPSGSAGSGQATPAGSPMQDIPCAGPMYGAPGGISPGAPRGSFGVGLPREDASSELGSTPPGQQGGPGSAAQPGGDAHGQRSSAAQPSALDLPSSQASVARSAPIQAHNQVTPACPCLPRQGAPLPGQSVSFGAGLGPSAMEGMGEPRAGQPDVTGDLGATIAPRAAPWTPPLDIGTRAHGTMNGRE